MWLRRVQTMGSLRRGTNDVDEGGLYLARVGVAIYQLPRRIFGALEKLKMA